MRVKTLLALLFFSSFLHSKESTFINPLTDICWECLFPITVSGINTTPDHKDFTSYDQVYCVCAGVPPKVGIPISFWEPAKVIEVTREPYHFISLGGIKAGKSKGVKNKGTIGTLDGSSSLSSFYHVHLYEYPILSILKMLTDFSCLESGDIDIAFISEVDPTWNDDHLSLILNPEASLFGNKAAQLACLADCTASSANNPQDGLFWCAGCEGSMYPFTGTVAHHVGGIQASSLLVQRTLAKAHRTGLIKGFDKNNFCEASRQPVLKKSLYKTQLVYPIAQTKGECHALGKMDLLWGSAKSYPFGGEDFVYLIWVKKQCCLDAVSISTKTAGIPS